MTVTSDIVDLESHDIAASFLPVDSFWPLNGTTKKENDENKENKPVNFSVKSFPFRSGRKGSLYRRSESEISYKRYRGTINMRIACFRVERIHVDVVVASSNKNNEDDDKDDAVVDDDNNDNDHRGRYCPGSTIKGFASLQWRVYRTYWDREFGKKK